MNRPSHIAIDKTQEQLRADGVPHAVATVVRTLSSTAAKPGMKAIILESGDFAEGWLGGGCVTSAVRRAAKNCLAMMPMRQWLRWRETGVPARVRWTYLSNLLCRFLN